MKYLFFLLLFNQQLFSQYNVAFYKTVITEEKNVDTLSKTRDDKEVADLFSKILLKNLVKDYKLIFENKQSNFKEISSLNQNESSFFKSDNIVFDYFYTNISNLEYLEQKEFLEKTFIISDSINAKWVITDETKDILGFECFKALLLTEVKDKIITAWFTNQILSPFGPDKFCGLPGLILEVNNGILNLICYKLDFENKVKIEIPTKGTKLSQKEFDIEVNKKFAEIQGFYKN